MLQCCTTNFFFLSLSISNAKNDSICYVVGNNINFLSSSLYPFRVDVLYSSLTDERTEPSEVTHLKSHTVDNVELRAQRWLFWLADLGFPTVFSYLCSSSFGYTYMSSKIFAHYNLAAISKFAFLMETPPLNKEKGLISFITLIRTEHLYKLTT